MKRIISLEAAVITEQGMRPAMEDAHFLDRNFAGRGWVFAGIYDGHGGPVAAQYTAEHLHRLFLEKLLTGLTPQAAFKESYEAVSEQLSNQKSGTTAVDVFIRDGIIYTANVGDARAIIVNRQGVQELTEDHRVDNPAESERILRAGGQIRYPYVVWNKMGLMPTRSIGDPLFRPAGIVATPSVNQHEIMEDDLMLVAACDGLFDFMSSEEVAGITRQNPHPQPLVESLRDEVLNSRSGSDNLTIIAISLT